MDISFDIALPVSVPLQTKNLTCSYEQGVLRYIRHGTTELIRMIYCAVRDADWGTAACDITDEHIQQKKDSFTIIFTAHYRQNDIAYKAACRIEGRSDDTIVFEISGEALTFFKTSRIGLCMHLPVKEFPGVPVTVIHPSGERTIAGFPEKICPHVPFSQVQQLYWKTSNDLYVQVSFSGDVFEAEDQRNWMDHSFKIYSRPLSLPAPFEVKAGDTMQQSIYVKADVFHHKINYTATAKDASPVPVPSIGFAAADEPAILTPQELDLLRQLPFVHYRAELDFETDWRTVWKIHCANAKKLGTALELVLFFTDNYKPETETFLEAMSHSFCTVRSILPLHKRHKVTPLFLQEFLYPLVKDRFPEIQAGFGTDIYFTELNRQHPENDLFDFLSFSMNPQVHTFDVQTMLENVNTIPDIMQTIRSFTDKPVFVSPVTFKKRKNHDGGANTRHNLVDNYDERQHTWFGAAWFLLCLFELHHARQTTFFKTTGNSGIIGAANEASPLYRVLADLKSFGPVTMLKRTEGYAVHIIFRNITDEELVFRICSR